MGQFTVDSLVGEGAIFQGATAASWYRYVPTEEGVFKVNSCGGGANTRLVIMLLEDCEGQTGLQIINSVEDNCSDSIGGNTASTIEVVATVGFSYVIYWDDAQSADGFVWSLTFESPENSQNGTTCATADTIQTGRHQVDSLTGVGTAFLDAVSAKWFVFIPKKNGVMSISSCESGVNTRLFLWEGDCEIGAIIAQDDNGCEENGASQLTDILVEKDQIYYIYWDDHFTKKGFIFDLSLEDSSVGFDEPQWAKGIQIFPNPAENQVFIKYVFPKSIDLDFSLINFLGQIIKTQHWTSFQKGEIAISVADIPRGIYYLSMQTYTEKVTRKLVVRER